MFGIAARGSGLAVSGFVRMNAVVAQEAEIEMTVEKLQRIVQLKVANVPDWQIAKAYNIDEDILPELYKTEEYQKEFAKHFEKQIEDLSAVNEGWDGLEKRALLKLNATLNTTGMIDPDFALKVAVMANKAARRPLVGNRPIDAAQGGTAVIYINGNFVNQMQSLKIAPRDHRESGNKKETDFIDPNQVEDILLEGKALKKETTEEEILDLFSENPGKLLSRI